MRLSGWIGASLLLGLLVFALLGDRMGSHRFDEQRIEHSLQGPSTEYWLGTDALGRDQWARVAAGAKISLLIAVGSTFFSLLIGLGLGGISGYLGGRTDRWLMRFVDLVYSLPDVLVIILLIEVLHAGLGDVPDLYRRQLALVLALGGVGWVSIARLVRGLVLQAREEAWVEAAHALGMRNRRLLLRHIFPNISGPILVTFTFRIPAAILTESIVSFIGLGIQPPFASWGVLASDGFAAMRSYPHLVLYPSLAISITLLAFHLLGDALRDLLDPRVRGIGTRV